MQRFVAQLLAILAFLVIPLTQSAQGQDAVSRARAYKLAATISDDGQVIGTPTVTVLDGQPAIVTADGKHIFSVRFVVGEAPSDSRAGRRASVAAEFFLRHNARWTLVASPKLIAPLGKPVTMEIAASARRDKPTGYPFKVSLIVVEDNKALAKLGSFRKNACSQAKENLWRATMSNIAPPPPSEMPPAPSGCCKSGCVTCCGGPGTCCSESTACEADCCVT